MPLFHTSTVGQIDDSSSNALITTVASAITSEVILAANANRKGAIVHNHSTTKLYLAMGATAAINAFTVPLDADDFYEFPFHYIGVISGIWDAANGVAMVTELT